MSDRSNGTIIGELIGEASTLWKTECGNEVFNSERAIEITNEILDLIKTKDQEIKDLKALLKDGTTKEFCYDLQVWVKDFLFEHGFTMAFQQIRQQVYTSMAKEGKKPTWGDDSYLTDYVPDIYVWDRKTKEEISKLKAQLERAENILKNINGVLNSDLPVSPSKDNHISIKEYFKNRGEK